MRREEKNEQTRGKILENAFAEFARHGYEGGSVNTICQRGGLSKGIIYHYFASKDGLYLACVEKCFQDLTDYLTAQLEETRTQAPERLLSAYFDLRTDYFRRHGDTARLFCGAVMTPPDHLREEIAQRKRVLDGFNEAILREILRGERLRPDLKEEEILRTFHLFQDLLSAGARSMDGGAGEPEQYEAACRSALNIFLYGIIERSEI